MRRAYQLLCVATVLFFLPVSFVRLSGGQYVRSVSTVPAEPVGIVFGAGVFGDSPSPYLASRLDVALALWRAHKIKVFLVSGDNSRPGYNEPKAMRDYLQAHGVPSRLIVLDYAGFDSWETCDRAKQVFGVSRAIVVSQSFHVPRAVYLCRAAGIETYGVGDGNAGWRLARNEYINDEAREVLAAVSAMYQGLFTPKPTFLGPHENGITQALHAAGG
ncbi:MAG TPA: ElyC/SanA/YdcF family protein [Actinocrinis sp.]|nr:ElyC/SanA/YdcF family protein [Actinocrinis sp.]